MNVTHFVVEPMRDEHAVKLSCKCLPGMRLDVIDKLYNE